MSRLSNPLPNDSTSPSRLFRDAIPYDQLVFTGEKLGAGSFGVVMKGKSMFTAAAGASSRGVDGRGRGGGGGGKVLLVSIC
jgi:hypothetical protein